jgi:hypothetical protein
MNRLLVVLLMVGAHVAHADPTNHGDRTAEARQLFQRGAELVKAAQWAEALGAFTRSSDLKPHPVTTYNEAACERALGRYTRAAELYAIALAMKESEGGRLPDALRSEAEGLLAEIDRLLVHLEVTLEPAEAAIAVDGRPLHASSRARSSRELVAGIAEFGPGQAPPSGAFALLLDPGAHLITVSRPGYAEVPLQKTYLPGQHEVLVLQLERLPAHLRVAANHERAIVTVDEIDVGAAPIDVARPAGSYQVIVRRPGFAPYKSLVALTPGQSVDLAVHLEPIRPSIVRKWWFWTSIGVVVTGVALGAYFGARAAQEPQVDGGGLQWAVKIR